MFRGIKLTSLATIVAGGNVYGAFSRHVVAFAVTALHGLLAVSDTVAALAAGANKRLRALVNPVALLAAVPTTRGRSGRAILAHVAFLSTVTTLSVEDGRVGALRLVVAVVFINFCISQISDVQIMEPDRLLENLPSLAAVITVAAVAVATIVVLRASSSVTIETVAVKILSTVPSSVGGRSGIVTTRIAGAPRASISSSVPSHVFVEDLEMLTIASESAWIFHRETMTGQARVIVMPQSTERDWGRGQNHTVSVAGELGKRGFSSWTDALDVALNEVPWTSEKAGNANLIKPAGVFNRE